MSLPALLSRDATRERLAVIFPKGAPFSEWVTRAVGGDTVFAMLYVAAVEGTGRLLAPKHVYRMSDEQAALTSDAARLQYHVETLKPRSVPRGKTWYADTSREPIRDETLRQGLVATGAVLEDRSLATTSNKPRYALAADFAALFKPDLRGEALELAATAWRKAHLAPGEVARVDLLRAGAGRAVDAVPVTFPNGEGRLLAAGESSVITKAVVEEFAPRFLQHPAVVWLSESGRKVVARDDVLARRIGLKIDASRNLPDLILADLGAGGLVVVFVEVVSTDGPVTDARRRDLLALTAEASLDPGQVAFVTAFMDRRHPAFRKCLGALAWNTFVWLASEPEAVIVLVGGAPTPRRLQTLLGLFGRAAE